MTDPHEQFISPTRVRPSPPPIEPQADKFKWFYKNGVVYEFTINPAEQFTDDRSLPLREIRWTKKLKSVLKETLDPYCRYFFVPEISEPVANENSRYPRLHVHGVVLFSDVVGFLLRGWCRLRGDHMFKISDYRPEYWIRYMFKQARLTSLVKGLRIFTNCPSRSITDIDPNYKEHRDNILAVSRWIGGRRESTTIPLS